LEYFTAIWYNLWPFGIACGHLVYFSQFGIFGSKKIWQPCSEVAGKRDLPVDAVFPVSASVQLFGPD
jgi:hypothetical protein